MNIKHRFGFTIIELLIVIVVIAILAAITIVAYNGIQQRAKNTAIINAASQTLKSIQAYYTSEGSYPVTDTYVCVTTTSGCVEPSGTVHAGNSTFDANITKVASVPRSVPNTSSVGTGITYHHASNRLYNGSLRAVLLMYFLDGQNQQCGLSSVMSAWGTPGQEASTSTTGYTGYNASTNKTLCFVSVP